MTTYNIDDGVARAPTIPVSNGRHGGHPNDRQLGEAISWLVADLKAVEQLRQDQLRKCCALRDEVYRNARELGISPAVLRALAGLSGNGHTS
jgi:hypothetical protein